ncbi:MAG: hypothetical protein R6T92_14230, partial [Desulfosalsimonadaceae bacterium]
LADKTNTAFMDYTGSLSDWALNSFFGRFSYSFSRWPGGPLQEGMRQGETRGFLPVIGGS